MPPTLSLHMICRNEENILGRCLDSVAPHVDEIVIADTGSTDGTRAVAAKYGAKIVDCTPETHTQLFFVDDESTGAPPPYSRQMTLGNFGGARNVSLDACTSDFILWLDADDVLEGGPNLRKLVESMQADKLDTAWFLYNYARDMKDRVVCKLWRERLIRRGTSRWMNPIHEVMAPIRQEASVRVQNVIVNHYRPTERTAVVAHRNYKVLKKFMPTQAEDARTLFYFGNEARFINPEEAITAYERYVEISGWPEERAIARCYLGELYESKQQLGRAYASYAAACMDFDQLPDGWFGMARTAYCKQVWADCVRFADEGFKRGNPESVIMVNPLSRTYAPYQIYNLALNSLGRVQEAHDACLKGLEAVPEDTNLKFNLGVYKQYLVEKNDPIKQALASPNTPQRVKEAILAALKTESSIANPPRVMPPLPDGKLNIVVWTGPAVEWWSPNSPKTTGIGGSETAVIEMCKHFAAMGHRVVAYTDCPHMDGVYDGVEYAHFGAFTGVDCDVFISSRQPSIAEASIKARLKLLWVHDVHVGQPQPKMHAWLLKFDRILCLSEWHKDFFCKVYPYIHKSAVTVTRNGIDPARFSGPMLEKKNRLIYSSSANRGLDTLLDLLPRIRAEVPDVELHVFYGFESWERSAKLAGNVEELTYIERFKQRLATSEGVVVRGRVNQDALAAEMMQAKVWTYPTGFTETFCITAVEAQAAECIPVVTNLAGLAETAKWGIRLEGSNSDPQYHTEFVKAVVGLLKDESKRKAIAELGRAWALRQSWQALAAEWIDLFHESMDERAECVVPRYEKMTGKAA